MKILDEDLLLKYNVSAEKTFNIDGSIYYNIEGHNDIIEEVVDLLLESNKYDYQINKIKSKNKNYIKYNIHFKKSEKN